MTQLALNLSDKPTGSLRPPCPDCGNTHSAGDIHAVGRFRPAGVLGYRARSGGPLRATRAEAEADACLNRLTRPTPPTTGAPAAGREP